MIGGRTPRSILQKALRAVLWPVAVFACAFLFSLTPLAQRIDLLLLDLQFHTLARLAPHTYAGPEIVIVGLDERTLKVHREPLALMHRHLGRLFSALAEARPAAVGVDLVLPDRSYDFLVPGSDRQLLAGLLRLRKTSPVVLASVPDEQGFFRPLFPPLLSVLGAQGTALALLEPDLDGGIRHFVPSWPGQPDGGQPQPALAAQIALDLGVQTKRGLIDFALGTPFAYLPLHEVLAWEAAGDRGRLATAFAGRVVLLGAVLPYIDRHTLPLPLAAWEPEGHSLPGVLFHAQALRSILAGRITPAAPGGLVPSLIAAFCALWWAGRRARQTLVAVAFGAALLLGGATGGLALAFWEVPVAAALLAGGLIVAGRFVQEGAHAARERAALQAAFGGSVSPAVLARILGGEIRPELGGSRHEICVLISDIRDFTTLSEGLPPEGAVLLLNTYFAEMTQAVHRHGGTVDKFIGDGLLAFFGAPNPLDHAAEAALAAAQEMLERLTTVNRQLQEQGLPTVRIGIGLHRGAAVVGHIGSPERHEYTAIGDTINAASRIEGLTKALGYPILCSRVFAEGLRSRDGLQDCGEQAVKGRAALRVYGWAPGPVPPASTAPTAPTAPT